MIEFFFNYYSRRIRSLPVGRPQRQSAAETVGRSDSRPQRQSVAATVGRSDSRPQRQSAAATVTLAFFKGMIYIGIMPPGVLQTNVGHSNFRSVIKKISYHLT